MADLTLNVDALPAPPEPPAYDFRDDHNLVPRARMIADGLLAGRHILHGDEHTLARAVIVLLEEREKKANSPCTLIVVEGVVERDRLQKLLDPTTKAFHVITPMQRGDATRGRRYAAIFVRYPSAAWFDAKNVETHQFQAWEREHLFPRLLKGGHFQHI
ncbi:hypothetical protein CcrSwift_gp060 [Caulobacter phage CcrSwift]|uniref:Uncharacterized protein n=1 Tax=Caulobacter phage CcrSwift TaxID=2927984 RepID=K4JWW2_9CAUD|nr:hypothetical protein D870_gp060 [Caulobacter phage CcrSwift]AFU88378.1 hypothetical protein CcrSwift_gp060 [Caulobacter phage CcrSwift]